MNNIIAYIQKMFNNVEKPQTYGSELEAYIVSKQPKSTAEVEYWTQEFDRSQINRGWNFGSYHAR